MVGTGLLSAVLEPVCVRVCPWLPLPPVAKTLNTLGEECCSECNCTVNVDFAAIFDHCNWFVLDKHSQLVQVVDAFELSVVDPAGPLPDICKVSLKSNLAILVHERSCKPACPCPCVECSPDVPLHCWGELFHWDLLSEVCLEVFPA